MVWTSLRSKLHDLAPWLALVGLWLLFELPTAVQADGLSLQGFRPSGDLLLLVSLWSLSRLQPETRVVRVARVLLRVAAFVLVCFRVDAAVCAVLMRQEPVLYDQAFLLRHLFVLIKDLWSVWVALGLCVFAASLVLGAWAAVALTRRFGAALAPERLPNTRRTFAVLWCVLLLGSVVPLALGVRERYVRWVCAELAQSVRQSVRIAHAVERNVLATPYAAYDSIHLERKPRVFFFFVESYGRVLTSMPGLSGRWQHELTSMERELSRRGWHFATAYSEAPISGGRSWLAHATVFTGTRISYQALFQRLVGDRPGAAPSLVRFMRRQGYNTVLLAPGDSERLGVPVVNYYGYDLVLRAQQFHYRGPGFGWGGIPDQYSLWYAKDHYLNALPQASFVVFNMVSSHAPWRRVPVMVNEYRSVAAYRRQLHVPAGRAGDAPGAGSVIVSALELYSRVRPRWNHAINAGMPAAYTRSVSYDLELIRRFLREQRDDTLVVIMGDHQPPLVTPADADFDVPIHVLARDPQLLKELWAHGFSAGLRPRWRNPTRVRHEALFSLIVRTLVRGCAPGTPLPPFLRQGVILDE